MFVEAWPQSNAYTVFAPKGYIEKREKSGAIKPRLYMMGQGVLEEYAPSLAAAPTDKWVAAFVPMNRRFPLLVYGTAGFKIWVKWCRRRLFEPLPSVGPGDCDAEYTHTAGAAPGTAAFYGYVHPPETIDDGRWDGQIADGTYSVAVIQFEAIVDGTFGVQLGNLNDVDAMEA